MLDPARNLLFTGLEWLVLYHLWESFPRLRRIPAALWGGLAAAIALANFGFRYIKRNFYAPSDAGFLWAFSYKCFVAAYFIVGVAAIGAGIAVAAHYAWEFGRRRARAGRALAGGAAPVPGPAPSQEKSSPGNSPGLSEASARLSRRAVLSYGVAGGLGLAFSGSAYAVASSDSKDVRIRTVRVPVPPHHQGLVGLRIAQLTDFHVGPFLRGPEMERLLGLAARERADLVVMTGDLYNGERDFEKEGADPWTLLSAPHGVYGIPGNHDRYFGVERFQAVMEKQGMRILRKQSLQVPGVPGLVLHGINDPPLKFPKEFPEIEELGKNLDPSKYNLLLTHRPEGFVEAARQGFQLSLAGHTHGGQVHVRLPFGVDLSPVRLLMPYDWGLFERQNSLLYVASGLGYAGPPIRIGCPPEIAIIEFVREGAGERARVG